MNLIDDIDLDKIVGGSTNTISGTIINALTNIIRLIKEAGYDLGSGMRRIGEDNLCSLK